MNYQRQVELFLATDATTSTGRRGWGGTAWVLGELFRDLYISKLFSYLLTDFKISPTRTGIDYPRNSPRVSARVVHFHPRRSCVGRARGPFGR